MVEFLETAEGIVTLISSLIALIGTGTGVFFAIKNFIKLLKANSKEQNWKLIMEIADTAIQTAEKTGKSGADKKAMVIETVKASCKAAGINADDFIDQLSDYIDSCITFVNSMQDKVAKSKK